MAEDGWIVVFDLDETIFFHGAEKINEKAVDVLKKAYAQRGKTVSAIFLLTNNSETEFINLIIKQLEEIVGKSLFNYVMTAEEKFKNIRVSYGPTLNYSEKRLDDIKYMCEKSNISTNNLIKRILFFDDNEHEIMKEMEKEGVLSNYALVKTVDSNEWNKGEKLNTLPIQLGGKRRGCCKRQTKKKNKQKKNKQSKNNKKKKM